MRILFFSSTIFIESSIMHYRMDAIWSEGTRLDQSQASHKPSNAKSGHEVQRKLLGTTTFSNRQSLHRLNGKIVFVNRIFFGAAIASIASFAALATLATFTRLAVAFRQATTTALTLAAAALTLAFSGARRERRREE